MKGIESSIEVIDKSEEEISAAIREVDSSNLSDETKSLVTNCINMSVLFPSILQQKNISIARLRQIIFGEEYYDKNKDKSSKPKQNDLLDKELEEISLLENSSLEPSNGGSEPRAENENQEKPSEHGRNSFAEYNDVEEIEVSVIDLAVGDDCPKACGGKLKRHKPGNVTRITGQNFAKVIIYKQEKLRCNLCDYLISAQLPDSAGKEKYDASFKSMLALQKYYVSVPFYRQEKYQKLLGLPLPDSTQWDLIEKLAGSCYVILKQLVSYAANSKLVHNDDTKVRILEVINAIKSGAHGDERKGMYTTGVIAEHGPHKIALFINGTQHAGENLADILKNRKTGLENIIQMCDGSSNNIPSEFKTIICNCMSHGFRKFKELIKFFPTECLTIMKLISEVYSVDSKTKHLTDEDRLKYHQENSKPHIEKLGKYMQSLIDEHVIEPNSELGKAIEYMTKRWDKLTRFLEVSGAPIDNNIVERALKIAIRNRKNAQFYRSRYSADIGGMITSIIYTCELSNINPHHYLTVLQTHQDEIIAAPQNWLPWNYSTSLKLLQG